MKNKARIGATLVGLIIGGISYWFQPYNQIQILNSNIPLVWSLGAFFGSLLLMIYFNEKPPKIALLISLGVALAVLARIIYDTIFWDATSHNLAPFEIILCGIITIPSAFMGVYLALLMKKLKK
jgi:uncharacterized membrane protein YccC